MFNVKRTGIVLAPNRARVMFRPFEVGGEQRVLRVMARVMALDEVEVTANAFCVLKEFDDRHQRLREFFLRRFEQVRHVLPTDDRLSEDRRILIGSYFTLEYSLESAALFNPSMVWAPDQSDVPDGGRRFVVSLRAVGEGHISSITFRSGIVDRDCNIHLDEDSQYVIPPDLVTHSAYEKRLFERKLMEMQLLNDFAHLSLGPLDDYFTLEQLQASVAFALRQNKMRQAENEGYGQAILRLARANYEITYPVVSDSYPDSMELSERVIFPTSPAETNGIEDARFVEFHEDDGSVQYHATYTAYDGRSILPQMLETCDFRTFRSVTLNGPEVQNKGMALFPRKVSGRYVMLGRQDGENIYLMFSDSLHFWHTKQILLKPTFPWEFVQLGNCGSPLETEAGWLVITHGVGPMRQYSIGACLLDIDDPSKVIGRLREPLLTPDENEREGYVPNVVYSCGSLIHNGTLILPYAMSDYASSFATVALADVLGAMV